MSVRLKLALSYAAVVVATGTLLLAAVALFLVRYIPDGDLYTRGPDGFLVWTPNRGDILRAFVPIGSGVFAALVVLGLVAGWLLAGRVLTRLARIGEGARRASAGSLDHRIRLDGPRDELREVADAFDEMLARLERQVEEQRRFAANASHELRTPLAITQALIDAGLADPDRDVEKLLESLSAVNRRAAELTSALLDLARDDAGTLPRGSVDVSLLVEEAAETLVPLAERRRVRLETETDPVTAWGAPSLLQQVVTNLLHNAIVHNLPGGVVTARTRRVDRGAELVIENTGAPVDPARLDELAEPFERGASRARSAGEHAGAGLGLSIVRRIVAAQGGTLRLAARPEGGLVATVALPGGPDGA